MSLFIILLTAFIVNFSGQAHAAYDAEQEAMTEQIPQDCWYCIPCNKRFYDLGSLDRHVRRHHSNHNGKRLRTIEKYSEPVYLCNRCKYGFSSYRLLVEHNRKYHPNPDPTRRR